MRRLRIPSRQIVSKGMRDTERVGREAEIGGFAFYEGISHVVWLCDDFMVDG